MCVCGGGGGGGTGGVKRSPRCPRLLLCLQVSRELSRVRGLRSASEDKRFISAYVALMNVVKLGPGQQGLLER